ncbi:hypothetical protein DFH29DRAFT_924185 [Suillus ampliporus]|nr:hypothetical protein DFH29DRAFT_924185 [Suillus ampliporus]
MSQSKELGTLVVVILKARHLHQPSFYKQDPYAQVAFSGGQHPVWDEEFRFPVLLADAGKDNVNRKIEVSCWKDEQRADDKLLGKGTVDIESTLKTGEFDDWVSLETSGGARGELYLEMTFYANAPPPLNRRTSKFRPSDRLARPQSYHPVPHTSGSSNASPLPATNPTPVQLRDPGYVPPAALPASLLPARGQPHSPPSSSPSPSRQPQKGKTDVLPPLPEEAPLPQIKPGHLPTILRPGLAGRPGRYRTPSANNGSMSELSPSLYTTPPTPISLIQTPELTRPCITSPRFLLRNPIPQSHNFTRSKDKGNLTITCRLVRLPTNTLLHRKDTLLLNRRYLLRLKHISNLIRPRIMHRPHHNLSNTHHLPRILSSISLPPRNISHRHPLIKLRFPHRNISRHHLLIPRATHLNYTHIRLQHARSYTPTPQSYTPTSQPATHILLHPSPRIRLSNSTTTSDIRSRPTSAAAIPTTILFPSAAAAKPSASPSKSRCRLRKLSPLPVHHTFHRRLHRLHSLETSRGLQQWYEGSNSRPRCKGIRTLYRLYRQRLVWKLPQHPLRRLPRASLLLRLPYLRSPKTKRSAEEEERVKAEEARISDEERRKVEDERKAAEEAELLRREAEEVQRRAEEERKRQEEEEQKMREVEEQKRREEERLKWEAEQRQREEEEHRRREEEERMRREEEERRRVEEERRKAEDARRKQEEEERIRREEEVRRKAEEERRKREEEARHKLEEERIRREEAARRKREEEEARRKRAEEETRKRAEEEARKRAEEEAERRWQIELARIKARAEQEAADAAFARAQFEAEEAERRRQEEADLAFARRAQEESEREHRAAEERRRQEELDSDLARREQAHEEELERKREEARRRRVEETDREMARKLDMELNLGPGDGDASSGRPFTAPQLPSRRKAGSPNAPGGW